MENKLAIGKTENLRMVIANFHCVPSLENN